MRDLLDKLSNLFESTGLAGRKPGDVFKNSQGDTITFNNLQFFPSEGGKLEKQEMDNAVKHFPNAKWQNLRTTRSGGFVIATFDTETGQEQYGFYKDNINPNPTSNYIPNQIGDYRYASKAAEKVQSGLTPQDLLTQRDNLTSEQIVSQLSAKLGDKNPLVEVAKRIARGESLPLKFPKPEGVSFTGFRDYFCEILQPMALQTGQYTGNAGEAAEIFLGGSFADTLISFDAAKNAGLSDSIMTNSQGKSIKISTKGGSGAQASAKNLIDSINELSETDAGRKILNQYKDTIDLIREIQTQGQIKAPLYLGVKFDIITQDEANKTLQLRNQKPINLKDIDQLNLGKNLTSLAKGRSTDTPENTNLFYHLIAAIAFKAAEEVNSKTDFSKAATDILNNGALVQVYTKASEGKTEWALNEFNTVFPGKSIKGVDLSASKNYFSTGIKGNFTFKIDRGGKAKETDSTQVDIAPSKEKSVPLSTAAKQIIDRPKRKVNKKSTEPISGVGRAKRK